MYVPPHFSSAPTDTRLLAPLQSRQDRRPLASDRPQAVPCVDLAPPDPQHHLHLLCSRPTPRRSLQPPRLRSLHQAQGVGSLAPHRFGECDFDIRHEDALRLLHPQGQSTQYSRPSNSHRRSPCSPLGNIVLEDRLCRSQSHPHKAIPQRDAASNEEGPPTANDLQPPLHLERRVRRVVPIVLLRPFRPLCLRRSHIKPRRTRQSIRWFPDGTDDGMCELRRCEVREYDGEGVD